MNSTSDSALPETRSDPIDFYFDFVSPFAYLASAAVEELGRRHARPVRWRPFRLGVTVTKVMGLKPLMETPLKGAYLRHDAERLAIVLGLPLTSDFSISHPLAAQRIFHALPPEIAPVFAKATLRARWADGIDIADSAALESILLAAKMDPAIVARALADTATHDAVRKSTEDAVKRGVFGSPTFVVGNEKFWGVDCLWLLSLYLENGERFVVRPQPRYW